MAGLVQKTHLIKAAFPREWNRAGDIREAAKKMVKGWDYRKRWIDERNYPIWIVDTHLKIVHVNQPAGHMLGILPWKLAGKNVALLLKALVAKIRINDRHAAGNFERDYLKFLKRQLKGYGFEWKTTLTLEREVKP